MTDLIGESRRYREDLEKQLQTMREEERSLQKARPVEGSPGKSGGQLVRQIAQSQGKGKSGSKASSEARSNWLR